jgi:glycosyltransferase involved in cell wall biosynthesis
LRILQVSPLFPPHIGGIEFHVENLSRALAEGGHEVTVYTSNMPKSKKIQKFPQGTVIRFFTLPLPLNNFFSPGLLLRLMERGRFDIVHVHSLYHTSSNIAVFCKPFNKYPFILTAHGSPSYSGGKNKFISLYDRYIGSWMLHTADRIIALTPKQADILNHITACRDKIEIVPNWIDLQKIDRPPSGETVHFREFSSDDTVLLYVGSLIDRKGINYLITAMRSISPQVKLVIAGGELIGHQGVRAQLEKQIADQNAKNIFLLGSVSSETLVALYRMADIFVLPSLVEGLPLTLLEAMAYRKCVIASDIPGTSDVIVNGKNGILFESMNTTDLAHKIQQALDDPGLRTRLGAQARSDIETSYSASSVIRKIETIYERFL